MYSKSYFGKFAYDITYRNLSSNVNLSEEEKSLMSEKVELMNIRYFSGTEKLNFIDTEGSQECKLWNEYSDGF